MEYVPDNWVVIKIMGNDPHYRILAGWSGDYLNGSSWRMNSGITSVEEEKDHFKFFGFSGSVYLCRKGLYCLRTNNSYIWNSLVERFGDSVELMPEESNWNEIDWIIK